MDKTFIQNDVPLIKPPEIHSKIVREHRPSDASSDENDVEDKEKFTHEILSLMKALTPQDVISVARAIANECIPGVKKCAVYLRRKEKLWTVYDTSSEFEISTDLGLLGYAANPML